MSSAVVLEEDGGGKPDVKDCKIQYSGLNVVRNIKKMTASNSSYFVFIAESGDDKKSDDIPPKYLYFAKHEDLQGNGLVRLFDEQDMGNRNEMSKNVGGVDAAINQFSSFGTVPVTSIVISRDSSMVATGHINGKISFYSPEKQVLISEIPRKKDMRSNKIKSMCFTHDNRALVAGDTAGHIYRFSRLISVLPVKEEMMLDLNEPKTKIRCVFARSAESNWLIYATSYEVMIMDYTEHATYLKDILVTPIPTEQKVKREKVFFKAKLQRSKDSGVLLVVWYGTTVLIYDVESYHKITFIKKFKMTSKIRDVFIGSSLEVVVVMKKGDINLIVGGDKPVVEYYKSKMLTTVMRQSEIWEDGGGCLYSIDNEGIYIISFKSWDDQIKSLSRRNSEMCFELGVGVYTGRHVQVYGLPQNWANRCASVQTMFLKILRSYVDLAWVLDLKVSLGTDLTGRVHVKTEDEKRSDEEAIIDIFKTAIQQTTDLEMYGFMAELYKNFAPLRELFLRAMFERVENPPVDIIPFVFYKKYIEMLHEQDKLGEAEKNIIKMKLSVQVARRVLPVAVEYGMKDLAIYIWTDYLHDYLSPVIYLFKTDELIDYMHRLFGIDCMGIKGVTKTQLQLVMLWFFTPICGTFSRLSCLFSKNWSEAPKFVMKFVRLVPLRMCDGTVLDENMFVDAILRTVLPFDMVYAGPIIDELSKYANERVQIPRICVSKLMCWAFTSDRAAISFRERIVQLTMKQHNVKYEDIRYYCERAGFARIVADNESKKEGAKLEDVYTKVIKIMSLTLDGRQKMFHYIFHPDEQVPVMRGDEEIYLTGGDLTKEAVSEQLRKYRVGKKKKMDLNYNDLLNEQGEKAGHKKYPVLSEPMKIAVERCIECLLIACPLKTVVLLGRKYLELLINKFERSLVDNSPYSHLLLKGLAESECYSCMITKEEHESKMFELTCIYSPKEALDVLKKSHKINLDTALEHATKASVFDCCIHICTLQGDMQSAIDRIKEELERVLEDVVDTADNLKLKSIDHIKREPRLLKAYNTVLTTFEVIAKAPDMGTLLDKMWKEVFTAFRDPLWKISKMCPDRDKRQSMIIFFGFFVVEALSRAKPEVVFDILKSEFCIFDEAMYKELLAIVFRYLNYNNMLSQTVITLLHADCKNLYREALKTKTSAAFVYHTNCVICNTPITGAGGIGARVFECGHTYHNNDTCGGYRNTCPLCRREVKGSTVKPASQVEEGSRARVMKMRALKRVEWGLRKRYGKDQDVSDSGNYAFIIGGGSGEVKGNMELKLPDPDSVEEQMLFLEL